MLHFSGGTTMQSSALLVALTLFSSISCQRIGNIPENHPRLPTEYCTHADGCIQQETSIVLDSLSHPILDINTGASCFNSSGGLNSTICPTTEACAQNCALEGVDYAAHGVYTSGNAVTLRQYLPGTNGTQSSVSPRVYLLDPNGQDYSFLKLLNQELSFTVDVSKSPCGENGALYLSAMNADGGRSALNPAGATYGTGYCDAQCGKSAWINGVANIGDYGACCNEMDLWEANARATALTPHACNITGLYECTGAECRAEGVCDESGCGFNPYALGAEQFYGEGEVVDSSRPFTVVTQFITDDGTEQGNLVRIQRIYVQDGKTIANPEVVYENRTSNAIDDQYCNASAPTFEEHGGLKQMGEALERGMVLIFCIWNDPTSYMTWLDAGVNGPCNATEGDPTVIMQEDPGTEVTFSNVKWGEIGSTY